MERDVITLDEAHLEAFLGADVASLGGIGWVVRDDEEGEEEEEELVLHNGERVDDAFAEGATYHGTALEEPD